MIGDKFAEVVVQARAGEEAAFEVIYRDLAPALTGFAIGRGMAEPDEIAADTLVAVARGIAGFSGDEHAFRSWIFSICYSRVIHDRGKARRRVGTVNLEHADVNMVAFRGRHLAAEAAVLSSVADARVKRAFAQVRPDHRDILLLRILGGLPVGEVARLVGKTESAVKMIQLRALEQLREHLQPFNLQSLPHHSSPVTVEGK